MDIYEQLEKGKETVALRVSNNCADYSIFGHIIVDVVFVQNKDSFYHDSIGFYARGGNAKHKYKDLTVKCTMDECSELPYGWKLCVDSCIYEGEMVLEDAEEIVKTLKAITKKLSKIDHEEGCASTFEEFVVRFGRVIGAKAFYEKLGSNTQYKRNDCIGDLRQRIRSLIKVNNDKLGFAKAS
jgi:hypothetical protein